MKKLIVLAALVVLSGCTISSGVERLGTMGDPALLPEGVNPVPLYQVTSTGSNSPKVTVLATHECDVQFETVPVIVKHKRDGVDVEYRDHRTISTYDCGVNTLAWSSEGSTKAQLINLGETAIQGGAFAGGMRLLRPAKYNSSTSLSGGNSTSAGGGANATSTTGETTQTTTATSDASTGEITASGGSSSSSSQSDSASNSEGGDTVSGDVSQSNDLHN